MFIQKRKVIIFVGFIFICTITVWIVQIMNGKMPHIDQWTRGVVDSSAGTIVYTIFRWITELGSTSFVLPFTFVVAGILGVLYRHWLQPVIFGVGVLGSHLLNRIIKQIIARERPSVSALLDAKGYSFPSGHAMVSMMCYGFLAFLLIKKAKSEQAKYRIGFTFALLIFLIGVSRFFINVHYLTDIVTGFVLGFIYLIIIAMLYEHMLLRKNQP